MLYAIGIPTHCENSPVLNSFSASTSLRLRQIRNLIFGSPCSGAKPAESSPASAEGWFSMYSFYVDMICVFDAYRNS